MNVIRKINEKEFISFLYAEFRYLLKIVAIITSFFFLMIIFWDYYIDIENWTKSIYLRLITVGLALCNYFLMIVWKKRKTDILMSFVLIVCTLELFTLAYNNFSINAILTSLGAILFIYMFVVVLVIPYGYKVFLFFLLTINIIVFVNYLTGISNLEVTRVILIYSLIGTVSSLLLGTLIFYLLYKLYRALEENEYRLYNDFMTGIKNRRYFFENYKTLLDAENYKSAWFIIVDLDNLKTVNDSFGHYAGDYLIKSFTENVSSYIKGKSIFSRLGGDEFIIAIGKTQDDDFKSFTEGLYNACQSKKTIFEDHELKILFSGAGIELKSGYEFDINEVINLIDEAMMKIKRGSKNRIDFLGKYKEYNL